MVDGSFFSLLMWSGLKKKKSHYTWIKISVSSGWTLMSRTDFQKCFINGSIFFFNPWESVFFIVSQFNHLLNVKWQLVTILWSYFGKFSKYVSVCNGQLLRTIICSFQGKLFSSIHCIGNTSGYFSPSCVKWSESLVERNLFPFVHPFLWLQLFWRLRHFLGLTLAIV